jgi:hypothetical protein
MQSSNQRRESAGSAGPSESARTAGGSSAGPADEEEPTPPPPRAKPPAARPKRTVQEPDRGDRLSTLIANTSTSYAICTVHCTFTNCIVVCLQNVFIHVMLLCSYLE